MWSLILGNNSSWRFDHFKLVSIMPISIILHNIYGVVLVQVYS